MMIKEGNKIIGMYKDGQKVLKIIIEGNVIDFGGGEKPQNIIYYTTTNGQPVTLNATPDNLVDNKYENGQGMLIYDGDATLVADMFHRTSRDQNINLKTIDMEHVESITEIPSYCFVGNTYMYPIPLEEVKLPKNLLSIGENAFQYCTKLKSIDFPNSLTSIGGFAFYYCESLTSITIPSNLTNIGSSAFTSCSNLKELIYAEGCTSTLRVGMTKLTSVTIPNSVTSIANYSFDGCSSLTSVNIPSGVTSIGDRVFNNCSALTSVNIPSGVTSIGSYAFNGCTKLTSIDIPNSVTSIGSYIFQGCIRLTSIDIPNSVKSIGTRAFYNCSGLKTLIFGTGATRLMASTFYNCSSLEVIDLTKFTVDSPQSMNIIALVPTFEGAFTGTIPETGVIKCIPERETTVRTQALKGTLANWEVEVV